MTDHIDDATLDALIEAGAKVMDLPLDPAWMPAIRANLRVTLAHGAAVGDFPLPDEAESAPVFRA
jgi:hypothetical protein